MPFDIPYGTPIVDGKLRRDRSERDLEAQDGAAAKAVPDAVTTLWPAFAGGQAARSNIDASAGAIEGIARIVAQIRRRWPRTRILLRGDFWLRPRGIDGLVRGHRVDFLFGLALQS